MAATDSADLRTLEPEALWRRFDELRRIPRASKKEARARRWVLDLAAEKGLSARQDDYGNLRLDVPASEGLEGAPTVVLQGHLDMVCVQEPDRDFDFDRDPIEVEIHGDVLKAQGTTLGADNGIGVAAALSLLEDEDLRHGPLGLLFTVEEEIGLKGAQALDPELAQGDLLLNLDSIAETELVVSCAGAAGVKMALEVHREAPTEGDAGAWRLSLSGLTGGHSGGDIHRGRANALKLLAELVTEVLEDDPEARLLDFRGGTARNALAREASALIRADSRRLEAAVEAARERFRGRHKDSDPDLALDCAAEDDPGLHPWSRPSSAALLELIEAIPHGVITMSETMPGLVQTSTNLALVGPVEPDAASEADEEVPESWEIANTSRGSDAEDLARLVKRLEALGRDHGARVHVADSYPGWILDPASPLLATASKVYTETFHRAPKVVGVHGGLECGVLAEKNPALDLIAFGADLKNPHAPSEQISIPSVKRVFGDFLPALVGALAEAPAG